MLKSGPYHGLESGAPIGNHMGVTMNAPHGKHLNYVLDENAS